MIVSLIVAAIAIIIVIVTIRVERHDFPDDPRGAFDALHGRALLVKLLLLRSLHHLLIINVAEAEIVQVEVRGDGALQPAIVWLDGTMYAAAVLDSTMHAAAVLDRAVHPAVWIHARVLRHGYAGSVLVRWVVPGGIDWCYIFLCVLFWLAALLIVRWLRVEDDNSRICMRHFGPGRVRRHFRGSRGRLIHTVSQRACHQVRPVAKHHHSVLAHHVQWVALALRRVGPHVLSVIAAVHLVREAINVVRIFVLAREKLPV